MNLTGGVIPSALRDKSMTIITGRTSSVFPENIFFRSTMKTKLFFVALVFSFLSVGIANGQDEFIPLSSSQFLKGLDNQDYLRKVLTDNGFTLTDKWKVKSLKGGIYEYWEYNSIVFVDMVLMRGQKADITVRIYKDIKDLPVRLLETFPFKQNGLKDASLSGINLTRFNKEKAYSLRFTQEGKNFGVYVWYEDPYYFFVYSIGE
jgi:hypothetical protein